MWAISSVAYQIRSEENEVTNGYIISGVIIDLIFGTICNATATTESTIGLIILSIVMICFGSGVLIAVAKGAGLHSENFKS